MTDSTSEPALDAPADRASVGSMIAKRTRKRGHIEKSLAFARGRAARLTALPPVVCPFPALDAASMASAASFEMIAARAPWPYEPLPSIGGPVVVQCDGLYFGSGYGTCERLRREGRFVIANDILVHPTQIERAARVGVTAVAPILVALDRVSPAQIDRVVEMARAMNIAITPEIATVEHLARAHELGARVAFVSLRDRDHFRPDLASARRLVEANRLHVSPIRLIGLFAPSLPPDEATAARQLGLDLLATEGISD